jgi:hypothetical protein
MAKAVKPVRPRLPSRVSWILCEVVRQEVNGKLSLLGVFTGEAIRVMGTPPEGLPEGCVGGLNELALVATFFDGQGKHDVAFELYGPGRAKIGGGNFQPLDFSVAQSGTIVFQARQFLVPAFGEYLARFRIGAKDYDFNFRIVDGNQQPV